MYLHHHSKILEGVICHYFCSQYRYSKW